jgi:hypothetical protein
MKSGSWNGPMVLRELYLSLYFKGDERNIGSHKKREVLGNS